MTTEECTKILAKYAALFPNFVPSEGTFLAFAEFFAEHDAEQFDRAISKCLKDKELKFFPSASEIHKSLTDVRFGDAREDRQRADAQRKMREWIDAQGKQKITETAIQSTNEPGWLFKMFEERRRMFQRKSTDGTGTDD